MYDEDAIGIRINLFEQLLEHCRIKYGLLKILDLQNDTFVNVHHMK